MTAAIAAAPSARWHARLSLGFGAHGDRTILRERAHEGPLQVQRAFYPESPDLCHVYVLHPPGGLVAGDALAIDVRVDAGARALVTTPAANKVYRGDERPPASVRQHATVAARASLEWFPQETIVFDGGRVELETRIDLEAAAACAGWEILCLGRPAVGEVLTRGHCRQRLELWRAGRPLCLERARLDGSAPVLSAPWGLAGLPVSATFFATPIGAGCLADVRALACDELTSATMLDDLLICRYLGASADRARQHFARIWAIIRPALIGRPAHAPRIWAT